MTKKIILLVLLCVLLQAYTKPNISGFDTGVQDVGQDAFLIQDRMSGSRLADDAKVQNFTSGGGRSAVTGVSGFFFKQVQSGTGQKYTTPPPDQDALNKGSL